MKFFNLRAVGNKIIDIFNSKYDILLNKIAYKSKAYKQLYNEYNSFLILNKHLTEINYTLHNTKTVNLLLQKLPGGLSTLNSFDTSIVRMTEPNDLLIVSDDLEKFRVMEEMKYFSGSGQVYTIRDLTNPYLKIKLPLNRIYIFSSVWLKDLINLENLVYIIENEKESSKL